MSHLTANSSANTLIIGLDFGTTFSGIAYAFQDKAKPDVVSILDWPGAENDKVPKVPTLVSYYPYSKTVAAWGAQKHKFPAVEGIKLLLDTEQENPLYIPLISAKVELEKLGKPAISVAADFIKALYEHALRRIETMVPREYLKTEVQKKFVLTVPAVWSDRARDATLKAAELVGLHPVTLIKEPEAAAMYTLSTYQERGLAQGDAFVICDAGGGTVDLISYEIESMTPVLKLRELVMPKGGMAGSLQLNRRFEERVKLLVGDIKFRQLCKTKSYAEAVKNFDRVVKRAYRGDDESWMVNFPMADLTDAPEQFLKRDVWEMKQDVVEGIFKPLILDIEAMVADQVNLVRIQRLKDGRSDASNIKAIFLVGGFGSNEYLKQCLKKQHPHIQIVQPPDGWSAIVKGAVLSQISSEAVVTSSKARCHYGVSALALYDFTEDAGQAKQLEKHTGRLRCKKMTWFIEKNEDLARDQKVRYQFYRTLPEDFDDEQLIFTDRLYADDSVQASKYPKDGVTMVICSLESDLRAIDRSTLKQLAGIDGRMYVEVYYDLCVSTQSANMKFSLEVKGEEIGSVAADYK